MKNLIATYRKDHNSRSGQGRSDFVFFNLLDRILGTRPASRPTNLLSSSPALTAATCPAAQDSESAHEEGERYQTAEEDEAKEKRERTMTEHPTRRMKMLTATVARIGKEKPLN